MQFLNMNSRVLFVLMWKHAVVRMRRFIHTTVDFVSPLLFFILIFAFKNEIKPEMPTSEHRDPVANTDILLLANEMDAPHWITYYPVTPLTNSLMDDVGIKLKLKKLDIFDHSEKGYYGLTNKSRMNDIAANMQLLEAVIIFQNMSGESWPDRLNYTIRMKGEFQTESYESQDDMPGPHRMFGYKYGTFMRIQWAVDTSYIKLLTGDEVPQALSMQEFPYYHTQKITAITTICAALMGICWLSLMLTFVFLMCRLLQERTSGIQELMKMVGVSTMSLGLSHFLNVLPCALVFSIGGAILLTATSNPLLEHSNGFLLFLMLLMYFNTIVSLAFVCSYMSRGTQYAATLSVLAYVMLWMPARTIYGNKSPYLEHLTLLTGVLPFVPMQWFWQEVSALEAYGLGVNFSNMAKTHNTGSVLLSFFFMLLQSFIFFFLAWYLSNVRPGQYGQALPWNFLCKQEYKRKEKEIVKEQVGDNRMTENESPIFPPKYRTVNFDARRMRQKLGRMSAGVTSRFSASAAGDAQYWNKNEVKPNLESDEEAPMAYDPRFFETSPAHTEVGIKIFNVSKMYPQHRALRNVSLEVHKGEITVLVGHNGAGKTTLMSIITGMTSATEGQVYVNGKDTVTQKAEVRQNLGLCPQHNLFFDDLTLHEHIMFFTLLKRGTYSEARTSSLELAERLSLGDKTNSLMRELSGGMKRRAQLACALAGGADVLVLDEPTSGLDVETRRELWDLLLSLRGSRTVLLSTHFMEEADALGDRVAALHAGELRCFATTMHLKKAVGTGYRLSFTTVGSPNESSITKVVTKYVPDATVKEQTINSISYNLPAAHSNKFPKLFSALEAQRPELGIDSIGVGVSTLEEVFLKLCSDIDTSLSEDEVDNPNEPELSLTKVTGFPLYMRQFLVLMKRQAKYALHKKWTFLIWQIAIPILMIFAMTSFMNGVAVPETRPVAMNLDLFKDRPDRRVMYHVELPGVDPAVLTKQYPKVTFQDTDDIATAVLRTAQKDILEYNKYLVGVEINKTDAKILYTTIVRHAAPVALNMLSNMLATASIPWAGGNTITTVNDPVPLRDRTPLEDKFQQPKDVSLLVLWGVCITFIALSTLVNCVSLPCKERALGSRHIHVMGGAPAALYWGVTLAAHAALAAAALLLPTALAAALLEQDRTIDQPELLAVFIFVLLLGCLSFLAFIYLVSFNFEERGSSIILVGTIFLFGVVTPFTAIGHELFSEDAGVVYYVLQACELLAPPHTLVASAVRALWAGRLNALCALARPHCPLPDSIDLGFDTNKCCAGEKAQCYFCLDDKAPGLGMIIMTVQFVVLMTMVVLTERGIFNGLFSKLRNAAYRPTQPVDQDEMVRAERAYVSKAITMPNKQIPDAMLVDDLHMNYVPLLKKSVNAVKGVSFSVKKGECFGLLGVNGAGKSSTFKMMTAEESPTRGNIFANGYRLKRGDTQYLQTLGYCPQFFGLDTFLTGEENLTLLLTLRGFDQELVEKEVKNWISIVGLEKYAKRQVESYSGGCVRRLGAASALCGRAQLALLDEPSAGVDVAVRRRLWTALRRALRHQRSVIITSHSMDEMEALCSRIAILSGGRVRALGTAAGLRAAHAQGHAVVFKVAHARATDETDGEKAPMNKLKGKLMETFNCTLKDEHKTMLHYHINESMRYSDLFAQLENLREEFPSLIEDYSVTETTLEEVFLSFAKEQHTESLDHNP